MNLPADDELDAQLNRVADDTADAAEVARLAERLRADPAARRRYRHFMALHAALAWDYAANAVPARPQARRRFPAVPAAFAALAAALAVLAPRLAAPAAVATVEAASGAVLWTDGSGSSPQPVAPGTALAAGTLTAEGDAASVRLRFSDGTRAALGGESEIAFSDPARGTLRLHRGQLTADVAARPAGRPLLISTSSAAVEVAAAGGALAVSNDGSRTTLEVQSGSASMRRLVDGQALEVAPAQRAVASLDARAEFVARATRTDYPFLWQRSFERRPPANSKGEWLPRDAAGPARVRAVPCVAGRNHDGPPVIHHGITARAAAGPLAALRPDSVLRLRWRTAQPAPLHVMLSLARERGGFGGNFSVTVAPDAAAPDADGWHTTVLPVASFQARMSGHPQLPARALVTFIFAHTGAVPADLEIAEIALEVPAA